jgi:hypothetical protein
MARAPATRTVPSRVGLPIAQRRRRRPWTDAYLTQARA